ncbi:hypothetical protein [Telmatospirillum sp.]|uniref:hypothetical protein n=1 Tax=Telmatospirillum sp. TaxID=2079197 RepID=UPI00285105C0|nr:hypothetical protein [Telmatospirillum sp.]MDR3441276.1 hypothetical protein [Telmatospirillum sp.]
MCNSQRHRKYRSGRAAALIVAGATGLAVLQGGVAQADIPLYGSGDFSASAALATGFGAFAVPQANFGLGNFKAGTGDRLAGHSPTWAEGFAKPELKLTYHNGDVGTIFGDISVIGAGTLGNGEAQLAATTYGNPIRADVEEAYIGYANDMPFANPGDTAIVTVGRQAFTVGDNFLIGSGTANTGQRAAYWLAPRTAFNGFGTLKLNADPVRADVFVLQNSVDQRITRGYDQPKTSFAGVNLEYFKTAGVAGADGATNYADRQFYVGMTYFNIYSADMGANNTGAFTNDGASNSALSSYADRDGMNVYSVRIGGNPFSGPPVLANASIYGEYVREMNGTANRKVNANAYYGEAGYVFPDYWAKPKLSYRYAHFSGDKSAVQSGADTKHGYDPLFYSAGPRDYGSWYMGEITGQYLLFNSNEDVHMVNLTIAPTPTLKLMAIYYRFMLDQTRSLGISNRHFDDEINLVGEYAYSSATNFAVVAGVAKAAAAARASLVSPDGRGLADKAYLIEGSVTINF